MFGHIINILLTELGRSVWENLDLGRWYRSHCVRSVLATSAKILPYRPPARLIRAKEWSDVTTEETIKANHKTSNWKAAGCDDVDQFWLKQLTSLYPELANSYNKILKNPEQSPEWLAEGVTFLRPKSEDTENPKNCRPTTCPPTMYQA